MEQRGLKLKERRKEAIPEGRRFQVRVRGRTCCLPLFLPKKV